MSVFYDLTVTHISVVPLSAVYCCNGWCPVPLDAMVTMLLLMLVICSMWCELLVWLQYTRRWQMRLRVLYWLFIRHEQLCLHGSVSFFISMVGGIIGI